LFPRLLGTLRWRRAWVLAVILLACGGAAVAVSILAAIGELRAGTALLVDLIPGDSGRPGVAAGRYCDLSSWRAEGPSRLAQACSNFERAAPVARPLAALARPLGLVHELRGWGQAGDALEVALSLCEVRAELQILAASTGDAHSQPVARVLASQNSGAAIGTRVSDLLHGLQRVDPDAFTGLLAPAAKPLRLLRAATPFLAVVGEYGSYARYTAEVAPGVERTRRYLVLGQDSDELRATGGLIATIGVVELSAGRMVRSEFRSSFGWDSAATAPRRAPDALERYGNLAVWFTRDANWWIDYQRTVADIRDFWRQNHGEEIDGVIATDQQALNLVLDALGGVDVPELGHRVTSDILPSARGAHSPIGSLPQGQTIHYEQDPPILRALSEAAIKDLLTGEHRGNAIIAIACALQRKHILLGFTDPELARIARAHRWDGSLPDESGDLVSIADASISSGRIGPFLRKRALYQRREDGLTVLTIAYTNTYTFTPGSQWDSVIGGTFWDWRARVYRRSQGAWLGYVRVVAPIDSHLVRADGWEDTPTTELDGRGHLIIGAPLLVYPGNTRTVRLVYEVPPHARSGGILVAGQPGGLPYTLTAIVPIGPARTVLVDGNDVVIADAVKDRRV